MPGPIGSSGYRTAVLPINTAGQTVYTIPGPDYPLAPDRVQLALRGATYYAGTGFFTVGGVNNEVVTWANAFPLAPQDVLVAAWFVTPP